MLDTLTASLGEITTSHTILKNKRPTIALTDNAFNVIDPAHANSTPEHILIQGELEGEVPFSFNVRGGQQFKGTPAFDWRIYCQRGEIRIFGDQMLWVSGGIKFQVYDFAANKVEDVDLDQFLKDNGKDDIAVRYGLQAPVDNIARLYEAFVRGETGKYVDFKRGLHWAEFIQDAYTANGF